MPKLSKNNPRLLSTDIYTYIASNSTLTKDQVMECFIVYSQMIEELVTSKNKTKELEITLPHIGYFCFRNEKSRRHKGKEYYMPINFTNEKKKVIVDKTATFERMKFKVFPKLQEKLKEATIEYE